MNRRIVDFKRGPVIMDADEYTLELQRSLCKLIHLAKDHGLNDDTDVNQAKELIRCTVLGCGLAGACDGKGSNAYPCPLLADAEVASPTPAKIGDRYRFEYSDARFNKDLTVVEVHGTRPDDLVFFHDHTHSKQKHLRAVPKLP